MDGRLTQEQTITQYGPHVAALALHGMDPLDDLAPWVPEGDPFGSRGWAADVSTAVERIFQQKQADASLPRDHRIKVHPDAITHAGTGLGCVFTVEYADGAHKTFRVNRCTRTDRTWTGAKYLPLFGHLLTGHYNDDPQSYTYIGVVAEPSLRVRTTAKSGIVGAANWAVLDDALAAIRHGKLGPQMIAIDNSEHCSRCGRLLTTPESLRDAIGPECRKADSK